ncbi:MAG: hypothetical protein FRX49_06160 [Trebouxia sp. A1-2]|nr:MAG: hypothetical protein FRX49_06160 [Trebouxia sp. A1-2]
MASSQEAGSGDIVAPEEATASSSPVEHIEQAVHIVSNLPAALRDTPETSQDAWAEWHDDADEDGDDDDEDIDIDELEEDMAELDAELDQDEWDEHNCVPGQAPHEIADEGDEEGSEEEADPVYDPFALNPLHPVAAQAAFLDPGFDLDELGLHELDPDDDVGLYDEEEDEMMSDDEDVPLDDWDGADLGDLIHEDDYHANLHEFQGATAEMQDDGLAVAVQFAIERDSSGQLQPDGRIPPFWGFPHDESDDDWEKPDDDSGKEGQESFFSNPEQADPAWFHLSAASNHFQSADSLSTSGTPSCSSITGSQNEEIVMLHNSFCLAVWRLPPAPPPATPSSAAAAASASSPAPSSAASPPDAAASCSNPAADPATAVFPPPRTEAGYHGGHAGLLSLYELAVNPEHEASDNSSIDQFVDPQLRAAALGHRGHGSDAKKCPLILQLVSHIALESHASMVKADSMANSVRFGVVGGRTRLLAACQNGCVYVFETGCGPLDSASKELPCHRLQHATDDTHTDPQRPVLFMSDQQLMDMHHTATTNPHQDVSWDSFSTPATTAVLSHFPEACNCAVASPDGQWVAVVGDASCLQLLHTSQGYAYDTGKPKKQKSAMLSFGAKRPRHTTRSRPRSSVSPGSQYCCWNNDSSLVAVSSDFYRAVMVFDVHKKQQVIRFEDHPCSCLAVSFAPWDPQLLVFAEARFRVYITGYALILTLHFILLQVPYLRNVSHARQRLRVEHNQQEPLLSETEEEYMSIYSSHIRGLSITPAGRLLIAHSDRLVQWDFLKSWSPEAHQSYPAKFREVAKLLLLASVQSSSKGSPRQSGAELGLQSLPKEVLLKILGQAVLPIGQWMTALPPVSNTQGFPEKPLDLETLKQQQLLSSNT